MSWGGFHGVASKFSKAWVPRIGKGRQLRSGGLFFGYVRNGHSGGFHEAHRLSIYIGYRAHMISRIHPRTRIGSGFAYAPTTMNVGSTATGVAALSRRRGVTGGASASPNVVGFVATVRGATLRPRSFKGAAFRMPPV
jgi:hypothetical protein